MVPGVYNTLEGTCCTFGVKSILNPLNVAFNDGFRKIFNIAKHTSVMLIINSFSVSPVSLNVARNLFYVVQNMLKTDTFQQLIAHLFLKFDVFMIYATYDILIYICVKLKLSKSYNNCMNDVTLSVVMFI